MTYDSGYDSQDLEYQKEIIITFNTKIRYI